MDAVMLASFVEMQPAAVVRMEDAATVLGEATRFGQPV
jgi:hypothetical protein